MSYKFNGGKGAVICDVCRVMFDAYLSYEEYLRVYKEGPDYCWEHKDHRKPKSEPEPEQEEQECDPQDTA